MFRKFGVPFWAVCLVLFWGAPAQAQSIYSNANWNWMRMTQAQCLAQADKAFNAAARAFDFPFDTQTLDGWLVWDRLEDTIVQIACVADDGTTSLTSATSERMLVVISVNSLDAGRNEALRDFLRDCFQRNRCEDANAGLFARAVDPQAGKPVVVEFAGLPGNKQDWISVVPQGVDDKTYKSGFWSYLSGRTSGTLTLGTLTPGAYEVRVYLDWPDGGYTVVSRSHFSVR